MVESDGRMHDVDAGSSSAAQPEDLSFAQRLSITVDADGRPGRSAATLFDLAPLPEASDNRAPPVDASLAEPSRVKSPPSSPRLKTREGPRVSFDPEYWPQPDDLRGREIDEVEGEPDPLMQTSQINFVTARCVG
jgi:hypothetical protein